MNDLTLTFNEEKELEFKPEKYMHIFLNHSSKLIEFLEFVIDESKSNIYNDGKSLPISYEISNTLLEMYLNSYKNELKEDVCFICV